MMYTTRNWTNDTTESQKEKKDLFQCSFSVQSDKSHGAKKTYTFQYSVFEYEED